jgi:hypothetical protein
VVVRLGFGNGARSRRRPPHKPQPGLFDEQIRVHEQRWLSQGAPTAQVRDRRVEAQDPPSPQPVPVPLGRATVPSRPGPTAPVGMLADVPFSADSSCAVTFVAMLVVALAVNGVGLVQGPRFRREAPSRKGYVFAGILRQMGVLSLAAIGLASIFLATELAVVTRTFNRPRSFPSEQVVSTHAVPAPINDDGRDRPRASSANTGSRPRPAPIRGSRSRIPRPTA